MTHDTLFMSAQQHLHINAANILIDWSVIDTFLYIYNLV